MQIRIGNLEVKRMDELNWGAFEVMPEGFDGAKKLKLHRVADDGRILKHTGTYHGTLAEALRRALCLGASPLAVRAEFSPTRREMQAAAKRAQRMRGEAR